MIIDLSSNNGVVDFTQLQNIDEIFIRTSLGYGDVDKSHVKLAEEADAQGFPLSYYHFAYPHDKANSVTEDATKQAGFFCDTISKLPKYEHMVIDLENFSATTDTHLSQSDYALWLQTFLDTVESRTGKKCIIYTYADYLNRHLPKDHKFGEYPLWIANYSAKENPTLPHGWDHYYMWQYSAEGKIEGIENHVDLTRW